MNLVSDTKIKRKEKVELPPVKISVIQRQDLSPVVVFSALQQKFPSVQSFLFESKENSLPTHSFLGIAPTETIRIEQDKIYRTTFSGEEIVSEKPLEFISEYLNRYSQERDEKLVPFTGGIVGYFSYDLVTHLENIPLNKVQEDSGATALLMQFPVIVAFDHQKNTVYLAENEITGFTPLISAETIKEIIENIISEPELPITPAKNLPAVEAETGEKAFSAMVKKIKEHISAGDIFQCVLSERFTLEIKTSPLKIYQVLRKINPSPYLFYLNTGKEVLLGSSPEMLIKVQDGKISMCPIAGTRPRGKTPEEDQKFAKSLKRSVKEKAEHLMLVDLGRNDVGKVSSYGSVKLKEFMEIHRYSSVMHLVSLVEGKLSPEYQPISALFSAFPAGTLSGAPKVRAMQIISQSENKNRGTYGGVVFCHSYSGYLDSCITIRSLLVQDGRGKVQAGAGIVADSQAAREYQEIKNKAMAVLRAIQTAQEMEAK